MAQDFPHEPGTYYRYSTHASHMLSAIVEQASGVRFFDFIKENLMRPLDIDDMVGVLQAGRDLRAAWPRALTRRRGAVWIYLLIGGL